MPIGRGDHGPILAMYGEAKQRATENGHTIEGEGVMSADTARGVCMRCGCEIVVGYEIGKSGSLKVIKDCPPACGPAR